MLIFDGRSSNLNTLSALCTKSCGDVRFQNALISAPAVVRQMILDFITREKRPCSPSLLSSLLSSGGIQSLDLWSLSDDNQYHACDIGNIIKLLYSSANTITHLSLGGGSWIYNGNSLTLCISDLSKIIFTRLKYLKIQQISSGNDLHQLLASCPCLQTLDISQPFLTDFHIDNVAENLSRLPVTKTLQCLTLPSSVNENGVLRMLLTFPEVSSLTTARFQAIVEVMTENKRLNEESDVQGSSSLKVIDRLKQLKGLSVTHPLGRDTVKYLVSFCSSLEELSLEVQECMSLEAIARLPKLKRLQLRNSSNYPASYTNEVLPLLQNVGPILESLSLENFDILDLTTCASLCPNLISLSAQWFSLLGFNQPRRTFVRRTPRPPFHDLRFLRLRPKSLTSIEPEAIHFLIDQATSIEHVELYCCRNFSDQNLKQLKQSNGLFNLRIFVLRHGHSLSKEFLSRFILDSFALEFIDCGQGFPPKTNPFDPDDDLFERQQPTDENNNIPNEDILAHQDIIDRGNNIIINDMNNNPVMEMI